MVSKKAQVLLKFLAWGIAYFALAKISLQMATLNANASPTWPPAALAMLAFIILRKGAFLPIAIAASLVNAAVATPPLTALAIGIGNSLEAWAAASIFLSIKRRQLLEEHTEFVALLVAMPIAAMISASVGVGALYFGNVIPRNSVFQSAITWWAGDSIGGIVFFPLFYSFIQTSQKTTLRNILAAVFFVLVQRAILLEFKEHLVLLFLAYPFLLLISFFGDRLSTLIYTAFFAIIVSATVRLNFGVFSAESINSNLLNLQLFIFSLQLTALFLWSGRDQMSYKKLAFPLLVGWLATALLFHQFNTTWKERANTRLQSIADLAKENVEVQFNRDISLLKSGAALIKSNHNQINHLEWRAFFSELDFDLLVGGVRGLGVVFKVARDQVSKFERDQQKSGNTLLKYHWVPGGQAPEHESFIIGMIEPLERNLGARGLDLATEEKRKEAAKLSERTRKVEMTQTIQLVQDKESRPGFLLFYPVSQANQGSTNQHTPNEPSPTWVYSPVVAQELLHAALNRPEFREIEYSLFTDDGDIIFSSSTQEDRVRNQKTDRFFSIGSKKLHLQIRPNKFFETKEESLPAWVAFAGSIITILFTAFFASLYSLNTKANEIARRKTDELEETYKKLELERLKSIQASKLAALGEMSAGIAHEINNPLAIIMGNARILSQGDIDESKRLSKLESILKSSERIEKIVKGLRKFSRTSGHTDHKLESLNTIINDSLVLVDAHAKRSSVSISTNIEPDLSILCDQVEIEQVLVNLIKNAIDAAKDYPDRWVKLEAYSTQDEVIVKVIDSGTGISSEIEQKLFQPFFTTKTVGEGTGLGLSITKGILDEHHAKISLDRSSKNTCFELRFQKYK